MFSLVGLEQTGFIGEQETPVANWAELDGWLAVGISQFNCIRGDVLTDMRKWRWSGADRSAEADESWRVDRCLDKSLSPATLNFCCAAFWVAAARAAAATALRSEVVGPPEQPGRRGAAVGAAGRRRGNIRRNGRSLSESAVALFAQHRSFLRLLLFRKNCLLNMCAGGWGKPVWWALASTEGLLLHSEGRGGEKHHR